MAGGKDSHDKFSSPEIMSSPAEPLSTGTEPFPSIAMPSNSPNSESRSRGSSDATRPRDTSDQSSLAGRLRSASRKFEESSVPLGFMNASANFASSVPSISDVRRESSGSDFRSTDVQQIEKSRHSDSGLRRSFQNGEERTMSRGGRRESRHETVSEELEMTTRLETVPSGIATTEAQSQARGNLKPLAQVESVRKSSSESAISPEFSMSKVGHENRTEPFENGYHFPPKHTMWEATIIGLTAFWKFFLTPLGFFVVLYGLNVVAWGGMIFLLLCNAAPAMCVPSCNDINSPRRIWIEIDAQVLTALFCVTGFGLIPWRFRDLYYLLQFRLRRDEIALRRLAGIHRGWFRLRGSQDLPILLSPAGIVAEYPELPIPNAVPFPITSIPDAPLTGVRAPPTPIWKLDYVIWMNVWNTFLQAVLSGIMWGLNRYTRPSWATGLFVALACIVAALAGIEMFVQGKKVKGIEGVPISEKDAEVLRRDREAGIVHWNNLSAAEPKAKKKDKDKALRHGWLHSSASADSKKSEAEDDAVELESALH